MVQGKRECVASCRVQCSDSAHGDEVRDEDKRATVALPPTAGVLLGGSETSKCFNSVTLFIAESKFRAPEEATVQVIQLHALLSEMEWS